MSHIDLLEFLRSYEPSCDCLLALCLGLLEVQPCLSLLAIVLLLLPCDLVPFIPSHPTDRRQEEEEEEEEEEKLATNPPSLYFIWRGVLRSPAAKATVSSLPMNWVPFSPRLASSASARFRSLLSVIVRGVVSVQNQREWAN